MKSIITVLITFISIMSYAQTIPFTGKRSFNLDGGASGSGTPAYYLDVKKNENVHFGYVQINQADGTQTKEEFNAGKYNSKMMKVHFKEYNETFYVKFDKQKIYLVDQKGEVKRSDECCPVSEGEQLNCTCESLLYK